MSEKPRFNDYIDRQRFERDYVCAQCGSRIVFPFAPARGLDGWTPVCHKDPTHTGFVKATTWQIRERERAALQGTESVKHREVGNLEDLFG